MTVQHLWYDNQIWKASDVVPGEEELFKPENSVFGMITRVAALCNRAIFMDETKTKTMGDASESGLIKFLQPIRDIIEWRNANPKLAEIPFNSTNKFQISVHKQENDKR